MSLIKVSNLTFAYEGSYDNIFENTSLQIDSDWKLGLIGRNGRGKTTFLRLLMGQYEYIGKISASVDFRYFPFAIKDKNLNTGKVIAGLNPDFQEWELLRELSLLQVAPELLERPFATLSHGEQTKVLLAAVFLKENSFLLIDEPTNHLDIEARELVCRYLNNQKGFILVSHDRAFLDNCIDHVLSINRANIEIQKGNFSSWQINKDFQDQFEIAENERLKKDVQRLTEAAKRSAKWSDDVEKSKIGQHAFDRGFIGHKAAKMMKRAKNTEARQQKAAEEKAKLLKNVEKVETLALKPLPYKSNSIVELKELAIFYGEKAACRNVGFSLNQGERIALQGRNGTGKSSILKLIRGEDITFTGDYRPKSNLIISYVSQDTSFLRGLLSEYAKECAIDESLFKTILRKLDFARIQFTKDMTDFSEGQKKKVLLARSLCERAHLYLWDEPLNYIDIFSRIQIEELLLTSKPTLLFVEHDRAFIDKIATKVVRL